MIRIIVLFLTVIMSPVFASELSTSNIFLDIEVIYNEEIERAMKYAPAGKTKTQLQLEAQKKSNAVFQKAALIYKIPVYRLKLTWNLLRDPAVGEASDCAEPPYFISINEILFLHNFDETINETISHEVAHVITCLIHPEVAEQDDFDVHGSKWLTVAKSLGSDGEKYHELYTTPIVIYMVRVELLRATDQKEKDKLQDELDGLIERLENE